ncbi:hypothetical protein [Klebsiella pneumoniae]|uniref:hypothetical protein n=1 Tax=Klebsiella pneumoniae TaxID=573 RepID=UPI001F5BB6D5|nr:hypothetical protein [Klebsiella pneumoniae]
MNIKEIGNVFHCDCVFSWHRGKNGNHNCADGLREKVRQLAAENVEAKKIISECREYFIAGMMNRIRPTNEGYLHMICDTFADETTATDRIVAGIKADGVALVKSAFEMHIQSASCYQDEIVGMESAMSIACQVESQLREGADK